MAYSKKEIIIYVVLTISNTLILLTDATETFYKVPSKEMHSSTNVQGSLESEVLKSPEISQTNVDTGKIIRIERSSLLANRSEYENKPSMLIGKSRTEVLENGISSQEQVTTSSGKYIKSDIVSRMLENPGLNSAINAILVIAVLQTMLGLGCTMEFQQIKENLRNPIGIGIAIACQFGIMPLVAFLLAKICSLDKIAAIAVLITGSCPGGNLSNLLTFFLYGDINLSVLMSTISTIVSLVFMPFCLFLYGTSWISASEIGELVPFGGILLSLFMTLIPVIVGMFIRLWNEKIANTILKISLFSLAVSAIAIMTFSGILFGTSIFTALPGSLYFIAFIMPLFGYGFGYLLAVGFRLPNASRRTVGIETGCQNSQLSSAILKIAFSSSAMGGYFLFPVYYAMFQSMQGAGFALLFRLYRKYYSDETLAPISRVTYDKFDDDNVDVNGPLGDYGPLPGNVSAPPKMTESARYQNSTENISGCDGGLYSVSCQATIPSELLVTSSYQTTGSEVNHETASKRNQSLLSPEELEQWEGSKYMMPQNRAKLQHTELSPEY